MAVELKEITLHSIGNGAAVDLFSDAVAVVASNIADLNSDPKAKREITLKFTFAPNEHRDFADIQIQCTKKLAPYKTATTQCVIDGLGMAEYQKPRQLTFDEICDSESCDEDNDDNGKPSVMSLEERRGK